MRKNKYDYGKVNIGEYQDIINEAVGSFSNKRINVNGSEGPIPHFHIEIPGKPDCCICIYEPLYFSHGSKQTTLSKSEIKSLNKWLNESNKKNKKLTNWEMISTMWNGMYYLYTNAHTANIPDNPVQPEYVYNMGNKIHLKESFNFNPFDFDIL